MKLLPGFATFDDVFDNMFDDPFFRVMFLITCLMILSLEELELLI